MGILLCHIVGLGPRVMITCPTRLRKQRHNRLSSLYALSGHGHVRNLSIWIVQVLKSSFLSHQENPLNITEAESQGRLLSMSLARSARSDSHKWPRHNSIPNLSKGYCEINVRSCRLAIQPPTISESVLLPGKCTEPGLTEESYGNYCSCYLLRRQTGLQMPARQQSSHFCVSDKAQL